MEATREQARMKRTPSSRRAEFFSNLDALKEIFMEASTALTIGDLVAFFKNRYFSDESDETIESLYLLPVLRGQKSLFYETAEGWHMNYEALPEHRAAIEVLSEARRPMTLKELRSEVAKRLKIPVKRVYLMPTRAPGLFKTLKLEGEDDPRWMLVTWEIANDLVAEMLEDAGREITRKEIDDRLKRREAKTDRIYIFAPEGDTRFVPRGKGWALERDAQAGSRAGLRPGWRFEKDMYERIRQEIPDVIRNFAGTPRPFTISDITESRLKQAAEEVNKTLYFGLLIKVIGELEEQGRIVRVRGQKPDEAAWRLNEDVLPEVYSRPVYSVPFPAEPFEILTDEGLDTTLRPLLSDPIYYFFDGDFSESAFPPGGMNLIITPNAIETGSIALSPPLQGYLMKEMGIPFGASGETATQSIVEIVVKPPSSRTPELSCFINTHTAILWGLGPWLEYEGVPGEVFSVQVDGPFTLSLTPVPEVHIPTLSDETLMLLLELREKAESLSLMQVVAKILSEEKDGLDGTELFHRVSFVRRVTRRHLFSLLSSHYAFRHREGKWRYVSERADWGRRIISMAFSREFRGRRAYLLATPTPRNPVETTPEGMYVNLPPTRAHLNENTIIVLYSRGNQAYYGLLVLAGPPVKGQAPVKLTRLSDTLVPADVEPPEIAGKSASISLLSRERLIEILSAFDRIYYQTELRKTTVRPFQVDTLRPVLTQKVKDHIRRLEEILEGEQTTFLALKGISIQLQANPTYEELQKILEEKYYSRGIGTRIGEANLKRIQELNLVRLPARILVAPAGEGEFLKYLLDRFWEDLKAGGFAPEEDVVQVFAGDTELSLQWDDLIKDRRRYEQIRQREENVRLSEAVQAIAEKRLFVVEAKEVPYLITSLGLHLLGYPEVPLVQSPADQLLKQAPQNPAATGYDIVLGDIRARPPKEARAWLSVASAYKKPSGRAVFVANFIPEDFPIEKTIELEAELFLVLV